MSEEQLALMDLPAEVKLTDRQQVVMDALKSSGQDGLDTDAAGALVHEWKADRWAHSRDTRCQFCARDGKQILEALAAKGLARYRRRNAARGIDSAWLANVAQAPVEAQPDFDGDGPVPFNAFPAGF